MFPAIFNRRLASGAYRITRILVYLLSLLVIVAVAGFIFLRIYGVPDPLLREALRRVNAAGVPVAVDSITLTLHGWRAEHVHYYSASPDDLDPLFIAQEVYFSVRNSRLRRAGSDGLCLDVRAVDVSLNPSIEWGVAIPPDSPARRLDQIDVSLGFLRDRILVSEGKVDWLESRFRVNGTIIKGTALPAPAPERRQKTLLPKYVNEASFQAFENELKNLSLPNGAAVDITFFIDCTDYSASSIDLAVHAEEVEYRQVGFSSVDIAGSYLYPVIRINRADVFSDRQSVQFSGEYNLETKQAGGSLHNSIDSNRLLQMLPDRMLDLLAKAQLRLDQLPRFAVDIGPAVPRELLNHLSGEFSVHGVGCRGLEIEALHGRIKRENNRLELTDLRGSVLGQELRADAADRALRGGVASGRAFWDGNTREFGVDADVNFDPNLLTQPLARVKIATNIIQRFSFRSTPPQGHVALGANVDDWSTFYINIQALANDVVFQGVEFSSVNVVETYSHGILDLDPVAALQGAEFIKGSARIDFRASTVEFDALSSMNPADLEDLICPGLELFGNHIRAEGGVRIAARGVFDWGRMEQTDFSATAEAERLEIPLAALDSFSAGIAGRGAAITVTNAQFNLYGGNGEGGFALQWNPARKNLPYETRFSFAGVDFHQYLAYYSDDRPVRVSGIMEGNAHIKADLSTNFFSTAHGEGFVRVDHGQLADLPLFQGFSRLMRRVFPTFTVFSITSLRGHFSIVDGILASEDAYFEGDVLSAIAKGRYVHPDGFDAQVQAQVLREGSISRVVRMLTAPLMWMLEMRLEGTLSDPSWRLEKF